MSVSNGFSVTRRARLVALAPRPAHRSIDCSSNIQMVQKTDFVWGNRILYARNLRTFDHFWCTDGNWGIFFSSNFHTPPVTTPVTNLGHVQIHKTTGSCIYYCIVNTWVSCRRIYEIDTRPRIVVSISGRFEDVGVRSMLGSWIMWKILRISNALAYIYLWVDAYFTPWDAQDSHGISVTRVREIEWLYVATIGFSCMYLATKFSTTAVETHGQWPMCTPWRHGAHSSTAVLHLYTS